jgi:hypothetical protein
VSTFPPAGLFTKDAATIARVMASKRVSPKGLGSAVRMVQFFMNRAGKNLSARRRRELQRAKEILQARAARLSHNAARAPVAARPPPRPDRSLSSRSP